MPNQNNMPQQSTNQWIVNYNGYQFNMTHPTEPTEDDARWAYNQYVLGDSTIKDSSLVSDSTDWTLPEQDTTSFNFSYVETDLERAKRNARQVGSSAPDKLYRDATFMGRFWDSVASSAVPFGMYESDLTPPDESSELWSSAIGGLVGAVPSFILASLVSGGVGGIALTGAKGAGLISKYSQWRKIMDASRKAAKLGDFGKSKALATQASKIISKSKTFQKAIQTNTVPHTTGLLGALKPYRNKILKIAEKNPKLARSLNLFSNNVLAFNMYGQTRFPINQLEGRLSQMGSDTAAGFVFSVAGLPTMMGATSKAVKYGVEPGMLLGAGMYSDLNQTDMSMEERIIHGLSLVGFHYGRQAISRVGLKQKMDTALRTAFPDLPEGQRRSIIKKTDVIIDEIPKVIEDNPSAFTYSDAKNPGRNVRIVNLIPPKKGAKRPRVKVLYEDMETGERFQNISGSSHSDAMINFNKKFNKNIINLDVERVVGKNLEKSQADKLHELLVEETFLKDAHNSNRRYDIQDMGEKEKPKDVNNPFVLKKNQAEVDRMKNSVSSIESEIRKMKLKHSELIKNKDNVSPRELSSSKWEYKKNLKMLQTSLRLQKKMLSGSLRDVKIQEGEFMPPVQKRTAAKGEHEVRLVPEHWKVGDFIKIPLFNENTNTLDFSKSGIGKYVGRIKDFKSKNVVMPETLSKEFSELNFPVFEIRTHGGARKTLVSIGGKISPKLLNRIQNAKKSNRPEQEFESQNPELIGISSEPIIKMVYGKVAWNPRSPLFDTLFTRKLRGRDAKTRFRTTIQLKSRARADLSIRDSLPSGKAGERIFNAEVYAKAPSTLKNLSKILESGLTPESAKSYEESVVSKFKEKLSGKRAAAREEWERYRSVDTEDPNSWFDMNRMKPESQIDTRVYEGYPEFDPLSEKPFSLSIEYQKSVLGKTKKIKRENNFVNGKPLRFKTRQEAKEWAETNWMNPDGVETQIKQKMSEREAISTSEYKEFRSKQGRLHKVKRDEGISNKDYRQLLRMFFPKSEGTSNLMTYDEVVYTTSLLDTKSSTQLFKDKISSTMPPVDFVSRIHTKWQRFFVGLSKLLLPTYTTLGMAKSKAANILGRKQVDFELLRQSVSGLAANSKVVLKKKFDLNQKQFENLSTIFDKKFEDFYNGSLDGKSISEIREVYNKITDSMVEMMIEVGVEVEHRGNMEPFFEAYDKSGKRIVLDIPVDATRVVKGHKFLDSSDNIKMPSDLTRKINMEYLESLRIFDEITGDWDNGWYIIGKTRYVPEWKGNKFKGIRKLKSNEVDTRGGRKNVKMYDSEKADNAGFKHHIEKKYLPRALSDEFSELIGYNKNFKEIVAQNLARNDPMFTEMKGSQEERLDAARRYVRKNKDYLLDKSGVFGVQHARFANLPPVFLFEANTHNLINVKGYKDVGGNTVKKGSVVLDVNGDTRKVGKVLDVYERNFDKIFTTYGQKVAHIIPTYKYFGRGGVKSDVAVDLLEKIESDTDKSFGDWASNQLELQINSTQKNHLLQKPLTGLTAITAHLGLSSPMSGFKNLILGQASNATVFGFRGALNGMYEAMADPRGWSKITGELGGKEAGVHELMSGRIRYAKYSPGLMRQTEVVNRIVSVALAPKMLITHIDNLNGIKTTMNKGMSRKTSMRTMTEVFKFTTAEIADMKKIGSKNIYGKPEYVDRAMQMSHLITQGGPALPFVPMWMGKWWAKPISLFYRVAYRMSENVVNSVVKPAIIDGNPVPMLRYMIVAPMSGAAIYSMYYAVLGEDTRNKFKSKAEQFWMQFIRAEGLAILSNSFDEMGGVIDSYKPAVLRTVTSLASETMATIQGKKFELQSLEDLAKENIVFLNHATRAVSRVYKPLEKRVNNSKRRQRQFTDAYFRTNPVIGDEMDFLTERSPYYRTVNESFWSDDPDAKARAYYSALNFVIHHEMKKDPSLVKVPFKAKKLAKSILKSLISRSRPIPSSWRERTTGKKTRYQIYYSKLNPKFQQEELELDKLYKQKVREFNSAINRYRNLYGMDAVLAPTNK